MAFFLISNYENSENITISKNARTIYYIQKGVYSSKDSMKKNMNVFTHYIYNIENNKYYTYIGITTNKENAIKIKEYWNKQGHETYIKEKITDNKSFITILAQYDKILKETQDSGTIMTICNQVLSKYEEMVKNEY